MKKWLSIELSVLLIVSMVAFAGFVSLESSDNELTGEATLSSDIVRLVRCVNAGRDSFESVQDINKCEVAGQRFVGALGYVLKNPQQGTVLLKRCFPWGQGMSSTSANCEGQPTVGPLGYIYTSQQPGTIPLYRCFTGWDHFASTSANCERVKKAKNEFILGYILTQKPISTAVTPTQFPVGVPLMTSEKCVELLPYGVMRRNVIKDYITLTPSGKVIWDECLDASNLGEASCLGNYKGFLIEKVYCGYGCKNGACLETKPGATPTQTPPVRIATPTLTPTPTPAQYVYIMDSKNVIAFWGQTNHGSATSIRDMLVGTGGYSVKPATPPPSLQVTYKPGDIIPKEYLSYYAKNDPKNPLFMNDPRVRYLVNRFYQEKKMATPPPSIAANIYTGQGHGEATSLRDTRIGTWQV